MTDSRRDGSPEEQAAHFLNAQPGVTGRSPRDFAHWIRRSPEHVAAVLRQRMLDTELQGLDPERRIDVSHYVARAKAASTVVPWPGPTKEEGAAPFGASAAGHDAKRRGRRKLASIAAGLGVIAVLGTAGLWLRYHGLSSRQAVFNTSVGQRRQLTLPDGSKVELNTRSSVQVEFTRGSRDVTLLDGEALFEVRHNEAVPFRVHVGSTVIQDVGTQFSVRRAAGLTTVSVLEGSVEVSADPAGSGATRSAAAAAPLPTVVVASKDYQRLTPDTKLVAGEQLRIVADGALVQRQRVDMGQATAWRRGRLVFSNTTLEEIVSEFNRYNARQIILVGDAHRGRRFSGVFDATDPQSFLEYLRRDDGGLAIQNDAGGLVIRESESAGGEGRD